eukprot:CAMPEP_0182467228 /NCGR_PEP_ID=MMETSP1319-20130603/13477_1 /TAXON_ID=172717 /ORGANISM="Bolidomonas pacifica, Strain RCC208" /LENGTH=316 /DNA_ID=CAMNT_0024667291 /DNA_START=591 /DNA_END=1539 /DNA_ORIENTATION=-
MAPPHKVLSPDSSKWAQEATAIKDTYEGFVDELLNSQDWFDAEEWLQAGVFSSHRPPSPSSPHPDDQANHPHSVLRAPPCPNSFLLSEVIKDVLRTHPDLAFYISPPQSSSRLLGVARILYVWARLNQGVKYVQGMNELAGVVFFVLAQSSDWLGGLGLPPGPASSSSAHPHVHPMCEALAYSLTGALLTLNIDVYTSGLDGSATGVAGRVQVVDDLVALHDPALHAHLSNLSLSPSYYLLRWVTTLLSREFTMPDVVSLWDGMLSAADAGRWISYVSACMVMRVRAGLLSSDFQEAMETLQSYPQGEDVDAIVRG